MLRRPPISRRACDLLVALALAGAPLAGQDALAGAALGGGWTAAGGTPTLAAGRLTLAGDTTVEQALPDATDAEPVVATCALRESEAKPGARAPLALAVRGAGGLVAVGLSGAAGPGQATVWWTGAAAGSQAVPVVIPEGRELHVRLVVASRTVTAWASHDGIAWSLAVQRPRAALGADARLMVGRLVLPGAPASRPVAPAAVIGALDLRSGAIVLPEIAVYSRGDDAAQTLAPSGERFWRGWRVLKGATPPEADAVMAARPIELPERDWDGVISLEADGGKEPVWLATVVDSERADDVMVVLGAAVLDRSPVEAFWNGQPIAAPMAAFMAGRERIEGLVRERERSRVRLRPGANVLALRTGLPVRLTVAQQPADDRTRIALIERVVADFPGDPAALAALGDEAAAMWERGGLFARAIDAWRRSVPRDDRAAAARAAGEIARLAALLGDDQAVEAARRLAVAAAAGGEQRDLAEAEAAADRIRAGAAPAGEAAAAAILQRNRDPAVAAAVHAMLAAAYAAIGDAAGRDRHRPAADAAGDAGPVPADPSGQERALRALLGRPIGAALEARTIVRLTDLLRWAGQGAVADALIAAADIPGIPDPAVRNALAQRLAASTAVERGAVRFGEDPAAAALVGAIDAAMASGNLDQATILVQQGLSSFTGKLERRPDGRLLPWTRAVLARLARARAADGQRLRDRYLAACATQAGADLPHAIAAAVAAVDGDRLAQLAAAVPASDIAAAALAAAARIDLSAGRIQRALAHSARLVDEQAGHDDHPVFRAGFAEALAAAGDLAAAAAHWRLVAAAAGDRVVGAGAAGRPLAQIAKARSAALEKALAAAAGEPRWPTASVRTSGWSARAPAIEGGSWTVPLDTDPEEERAFWRWSPHPWRPIGGRAAVADGGVYVSGRDGTTALDLATGAVRWRIRRSELPAAPEAERGYRARAFAEWPSIRPQFDGLRELAPVVAGDRVMQVVRRRAPRWHAWTPDQVLEARRTTDGALLWSTENRPELRDDDACSAPTVVGDAALLLVRSTAYPCGFSLVALDLGTGALRWRTSLGNAFVDLRDLEVVWHKITPRPTPEWAGPPTVVDGVAYVGTGAGVVAAVDAGSGAVRWVHTYPTKAFDGHPPLARLLYLRAPPRVLVDGDLAVIAPRDAACLLALDRRDGRGRWTTPVSDARELVGIADAGGHRTLVAQGTAIEAIDLASGERRWRWAPTAADGQVLGGGALVADEVWCGTRQGLRRLRLADGTVAGGEPWAALGAGEPLGNLVVLPDRVLGQGVGGSLVRLGRSASASDAAGASAPGAALIPAVPLAPEAARLLQRWRIPGRSTLLAVRNAAPDLLLARNGGDLLRLDATASRVLWRRILAEPQVVDAMRPVGIPRDLLQAGDTLVVRFDDRVEGWDLASGRTRWTYGGPPAATPPDLAVAERRGHDLRTLMAAGDAIIATSPKQVLVLAAGDGSERRRLTAENGRAVVAATLAGDRVAVVTSGPHDKAWRLDLHGEAGAPAGVALPDLKAGVKPVFGLVDGLLVLVTERRATAIDPARAAVAWNVPIELPRGLPFGDAALSAEAGRVVVRGRAQVGNNDFRHATVAIERAGTVATVQLGRGLVIADRVIGPDGLLVLADRTVLWKPEADEEFLDAEADADRLVVLCRRQDRDRTLRMYLLASATGTVLARQEVPGCFAQPGGWTTWPSWWSDVDQRALRVAGGRAVYASYQGLHAVGSLDPAHPAPSAALLPADAPPGPAARVAELRLRLAPPAAIPALRLATPPTIDGFAGDWGAVPPVTVGGAEAVRPATVPGRWSGPADGALQVRLGWDDAALYLLAEVDDDRHAGPGHGGTPAAGDHLAVFIAGNAGPGLIGDRGLTLVQTALAGETATTTHYQWESLDKAEMLRPLPLTSRVTRAGQRTTYEMALPWASLGDPAKIIDLPLRLGVAAVDWDGPARAGALELGAGIVDGLDPSLLIPIERRR